MACGEDLVQLVHLVCLVSLVFLVQRRNKRDKPDRPNKPNRLPLNRLLLTQDAHIVSGVMNKPPTLQ